ncbi:MAG: prepilin-type N-terminal cleavage/methylation domain-containing protein, partial [Dehalococcoidia bacterium]|nr:prepilin-type N-terminal cleavage/methylation domain-containing protein [Dehalococcoidia bacterium]
MRLRDDQGFTMVETVITLAVIGLIVPALVGVLYLTLALPLRGSNTLTASTEAEQALETISRDGRSAVAFATPAGLPG